MSGASPTGRATRASTEPASSLGHSAGIPSAHTSGPWGIVSISRDTGAIGIGKDRILIAEAHNGYSFWDVVNGREPAEQFANARLIAAAPDLLAALKSLVANINEFGAVTDGEFMEQADAAISKAMGHTAQAIEARRAATLGAVHESAVPEGDAPEAPHSHGETQ